MQPFRKLTGDVVVIGAGVAGCSAFYNLAKLGEKIPGFKPILVDALPPMSLTR
jgi:flavin-dependent dehydrogenase